MFSDSFCHSVQDAFQIIELPCILDLYNNDFVLTVSGFNIYPVEFIIDCLLVAFTFQYLYDFHVFTEKDSQETFQYAEICLLAEKPFHSPVKAYIFVLLFHINLIFRLLQSYDFFLDNGYSLTLYFQ